MSATGGTTTPPVAGDCGIADVLRDGSPKKGTWSGDCSSSKAKTGHNARYYQFTLTEAADVTVTLDSDEDKEEPVLYLRKGADVTSGDTVPVGFNEGLPSDYTRAQIELENLAAATYTIEATTYSAGYEGPFTLTVSVAGGTGGPPPADGCDIAEIAANGSPVPGSWGDDCVSDVRTGRQARYYQFTLTESAEVSVVLESQEAETVLYLRKGAGVTSGDTVQDGFNDGESEYNYRRASIEQSLAAETYTIEATTYAAGKTGSFTLTVSGAGATGGVPVATTPAPLGDNLQWVARYDNTTDMWFVYDLSGTFSLSDLPPNMTGVPYSEFIGDLTHIQSGDITWIKVSETQTATLGGETRTFHAGLTLFAWP